MKIEEIALTRMRNETHYQFFLVLKELIERFPVIATDIAEKLSLELMELIILEGQTVDAVRASEYTEPIATADSRRDRAIVGFNAAVDAALHHYDPATVAAAHPLKLRLKAFHGSIEQKSYEQESAAVTILLADLQTAHAAQVATLGLQGWVDELAAAQTGFDSLFALRNEERDHRNREKLRGLRKRVDVAYKNFVTFINAYTLIDGDRDCGGLIRLLNQEIEYLKTHDLSRTRTDIADAEPAPIPEQQYTGRPCTPLPDVLYTSPKGDAVSLEFGKDYSVTYKKNIKAGNAECTIHGKGAYRGRKTVTFIISRKVNE